MVNPTVSFLVPRRELQCSDSRIDFQERALKRKNLGVNKALELMDKANKVEEIFSRKELYKLAVRTHFIHELVEGESIEAIKKSFSIVMVFTSKSKKSYLQISTELLMRCITLGLKCLVKHIPENDTFVVTHERVSTKLLTQHKLYYVIESQLFKGSLDQLTDKLVSSPPQSYALIKECGPDLFDMPFLLYVKSGCLDVIMAYRLEIVRENVRVTSLDELLIDEGPLMDVLTSLGCKHKIKAA